MHLLRRTAKPSRWLQTLRSRLVAGAFVALLMASAITAWQMGASIEAQLLRSAAQREAGEARHTADMIGRRMSELQAALRLVGEQLTPATLDDPKRLGAFLEDKRVLRSMFANVFAAAADGRLRVVVDAAGARQPQTSIADREYFVRTVATALPVVSDPIKGRVSGEAVVIVTRPLVDHKGVWGVVGGALRLASRDLLEDLASPPESGTGVRVVISDAAGRILAHPHKDRLLENISSETGLAAAQADWLGAPEPAPKGSRIWVGEDELVAMAIDPLTNWRVWRVMPRDVLLAPVRSARNQALRGAAALALVMALVFLCFVVWQLRPLVQLERGAAQLMAGEADATAWPSDRGEIGRLARTLRHIWAERAQIESFNAQVLQKLGSVMAAAPVGLAFTRAQRFELVSAEFCRMMGRPEEALLGKATQLIFASNEDYLALGPQVGAAFASGDTYVGDRQLLRGDASVFWARLHARPVAADDMSQGTIWSVYDVSEQIDDRRRLEHAAMHDALTGVTNRKGFDLAITTAFANRLASPDAALVMIDLDHFKPINDTAGHAAGDAVLKAVAAALASQVRSSDVVARIGGDEFAVLLPGCDMAHAQAVAAKLRGAVADLALPWDGRVLRVGASMGVAAMSPSQHDCAEWQAQADAVCYEIKRQGRAESAAAGPAARLKLVGAG